MRKDKIALFLRKSRFSRRNFGGSNDGVREGGCHSGNKKPGAGGGAPGF